MKVKIDTKEKFHVITLQEPVLSANMTEKLNEELLRYPQKEIRNVVVKLGQVKGIDKSVAHTLYTLQQTFYDKNASFVICEMQKPVEEIFEQLNLMDVLNYTPTESEAWDIVQMEEIEREFLD
ncbi:MAG TPA: STAS domain-containing protein [Chitinophagaceae bacterium]|nr:STAS domain-containing protein [Chitinophagaceae bacterium]